MTKAKKKDLPEETKKELSDEDLIKISDSYYNEANDSWLLVRSKCDKILNLYNNDYDFSKKAPWQSQSWVPKVPSAIRKTAAILKRSLVRAKEMFTVTTDIKKYKTFAPAIQQLIKTWLIKLKFTHSFIESLQMGLMCNLMIFKVYFKLDENVIEETILPVRSDSITDYISPTKGLTVEQQMIMKLFPESSFLPPEPGIEKSALKLPVKLKNKVTKQKRSGTLYVVPINPFYWNIDPTGRNKYCYHTVFLDVGDFTDRAESMGYNTAFIKELKESDYTEVGTTYAETAHTGRLHLHSHRKQIMLREYWGDVINSDGEIVHRNVTWTIANGKHVVRKPIKNWFLHGTWPFVWGPVTKKPFSVWHKSFLEDSYKLAESITDLFNVLMDSNTYAMAKAFELDLDVVDDPDQVAGGVVPGKTLFKRGGGNPGMRMVQEITLGTTPVQGLRIFQALGELWENETGLTEFITGKPTQRGRATATEVTEKGGQAMSMMEDLAFDVEDFVLAPLLEMIYKVLLQFQVDFEDPRLASLSDAVKKELYNVSYLSNEQKKRYIDVFNFNCRGMSGIIAKIAEMKKVLMFLKEMSQIPGALDRVKMDELISKVVEGMNWDPMKILLSDDEYKAKMKAKLEQIKQQKQEAREEAVFMAQLQSQTKGGGQAGG